MRLFASLVMSAACIRCIIPEFTGTSRFRSRSGVHRKVLSLDECLRENNYNLVPPESGSRVFSEFGKCGC